MTNDHDPQLEDRLHSLLSGDLTDSDRAELLAQVATDESTRRLLEEMVRLQRDSRRVFGVERGGERVQRSVIKLQHEMQSAGAGALGMRRSGWRALIPALTWLVRVAAVVVVGLSVVMTIQSQQDASSARRDIDMIQDELTKIRLAVETPPLNGVNLAEYRQLWRQIQEASGDDLPWVVLQDGRGKFGTVHLEGEAVSRTRMRLVRCFLVDDESRTLTTIDMLLPDEGELQLAVSDAAEIAGVPIHMTIETVNGSTSMGLRFGDDNGQAIGLRGSAQIDDQPVEIGHVRLKGQRLRVVVQSLHVREKV
ncbi:MAG: hypothetical protein ACYS8X_02070 [Planctomycetota bacterium]|jgi:hypothetical protein